MSGRSSGGGRRGRPRRPAGGGGRSGGGFARTSRVNELLREILADELERIEDHRLEGVAITGVFVDADLKHAKVLFDTREGAEGDGPALEAFGERRVRLQAAIGRQATMRNTPTLTFAPDDTIRSAERIDAILRANPLRETEETGEETSAEEETGAKEADTAETGGEETDTAGSHGVPSGDGVAGDDVDGS